MTEQPSRLDEIRERLEAASPGPWEQEKNEVFRPGIFGPKGTGYFGEGNIANMAKYDNNLADAALIAHMREDMALLLAVVNLVLRGETPANKVAWHHSQIPMAYDSGLAAEHAEHEKAWAALT